MADPVKVFLGFDFGTKAIGVAVGQTTTCTATALQTLNAKNGIPKWDEIKRLIKEWQPSGLVVGFPLNMDGTEQTITQAARHFANELNRRFHLPVYLSDERLTTQEARAEIFAQQGFKGLTRENVNRVAAKLILESWLASQG